MAARFVPLIDDEDGTVIVINTDKVASFTRLDDKRTRFLMNGPTANYTRVVRTDIQEVINLFNGVYDA